MRKIYLFLVGLCWFLPTNAQLPVIPVSIDKYTVIDTINYFVTYELTIVNNPEESKKPAKDIVVLEVGNRSGRSAPLRVLSPLRTVRESFPSHGSSKQYSFSNRNTLIFTSS
ncbi:hypothetical protein, partial [Bacteroides pyogenes]|uniref:hypothetical protein n=1 Tax=Bacteroides pyogenes TaxID=310300 RepID=UPI001CA386D7